MKQPPIATVLQQKIVQLRAEPGFRGIPVGLQFLPAANPRQEQPHEGNQQQQDANFGVVVMAVPHFVGEDTDPMDVTQLFKPPADTNTFPTEGADRPGDVLAVGLSEGHGWAVVGIALARGWITPPVTGLTTSPGLAAGSCAAGLIVDANVVLFW